MTNAHAASMKEIRLIFLHELKDILKDRTVLFLTVVLPIIIYPLLLGGMNTLINSQVNRLKQETMRMTLTGFPDSVHVWTFLQTRHEKLQELPAISDPATAIVNKDLDFWMEFFPPRENDPGCILVHFSTSNERARSFLKTLMVSVNDLRWDLAAAALSDEKGIVTADSLGLVKALAIDVSTAKKRSGYYAGKFVPLLMILMILSGASFAAVDLLAGEKERGTLETLLLAPVQRRSIIWGKFLAVLGIALLSAFLNLFGIYLTFILNLFHLPTLEGLSFSLSLLDIALLLLFSIPMAILFSSILMIIASYADSFKEGQYYVLPVILLAILPGLPALLPGISLDTIVCITPVTSLAIAIKEVLNGIYHPLPLVLAIASNILYAVFLLRFAARILDRETILPGVRPTPSLHKKSFGREVTGLFGICFLLLYYIGSLIQQADLILGLWATQIFLIALPALLFVSYIKEKPARFLHLKSFSVRQMFGAFGFELVTFVVAILASNIQDSFLPAPKSFAEDFSSIFFNTGWPPWFNVLTFGLSAGICEELLFRGSIFRGLKVSMKPWQAIVISAALFGFFHFNIYRFLPTALIGASYAYICWKTDSLYPTMFLHAIHNMTAVFLVGSYPGLFEDALSKIVTIPGLIVLFAVTVGSWVLLQPSEKSETVT